MICLSFSPSTTLATASAASPLRIMPPQRTGGVNIFTTLVGEPLSPMFFSSQPRSADFHTVGW